MIGQSSPHSGKISINRVKSSTFADASGCGNEVATERSMVRKYIIDSLKYWVNEFHLDGFRFDLMGVYDIETMWSIREEMDRISPGLLLYGEGWTAAESPMRESYRAVKGNIARLPGIAAFNDDFRDALVGNHGLENTRGFISGLGLREESVKFGIIGATEHPQIVYDYVETSVKPWAANSSQCINYATCHDNYTLWDRLKLSCPEATDNEMRKMVRLSGALLLTSQGIPFLHSGMEFCRTKGGDGNSYKSPDTVNQINWSLKSDYLDVFEYFRKLIYLRKKHPALRMNDPSMIKNTIHFCTDYKTGMAGYCLDGKAVNDPWEYAVLIFNGNREALSVSIPEGKYLMIANGDDINENGIGETVSEEIKIEGISMVILAIIK